tara:strand:+ start:258 stop:431 length:174 start_codon:yes stop_codon:yes gene_type:complete
MKIIVGFIMACALTFLCVSLNKAVEETVEVMQYVPYIMDPPEVDSIDAMLLHNKKMK